MRKLLTLFIIFLVSSSVAFAQIGYDPNLKTKVYDDSYNRALYKKLKDDFYKKYPDKIIKNKDGSITYIDTAPFGAYRDEVITPYDLQKQNEYVYIDEK